jgi:SPP1 family predicted phage head-tail adaptor
MAVTVRAGDLRHRVIVKQKATQTPNAVGEPQTTWSTLATVWAKVAPLSAREAERAKSVGEMVSHTVELRYRSDITAGMKITHRTRDLYINGVMDVDEAKVKLMLYCSEVPSGQ